MKERGGCHWMIFLSVASQHILEVSLEEWWCMMKCGFLAYCIILINSITISAGERVGKTGLVSFVVLEKTAGIIWWHKSDYVYAILVINPICWEDCFSIIWLVACLAVHEFYLKCFLWCMHHYWIPCSSIWRYFHLKILSVYWLDIWAQLNRP